MLSELRKLFERLESLKRSLAEDLEVYLDPQLKWQPSTDRWSLLMAANHIVSGEKGLLQSADELRKNPVRSLLQRGQMFDVVLDMLERDIPVEVPHPSLEPENEGDLESLLVEWTIIRKALQKILEGVEGEAAGEMMFSHPAAGPLDAIGALHLALAHFGTHRRQIDRLRRELGESG
jgi:hypothetical protein